VSTHICTRIVTYSSIKPVVQTALSEKEMDSVFFVLFFDSKAHKEVDDFVHLWNLEFVDVLLLVVVSMVFTGKGGRSPAIDHCPTVSITVRSFIYLVPSHDFLLCVCTFSYFSSACLRVGPHL